MLSVASVRPDLIPLFKDATLPYSISAGSGKKVTLVCQECGLEVSRRTADLVHRGFHCPICYGGYSYPSRMVASTLLSLGINFTTEAVFPWAGKYRYDFYIESAKAIIEVNGEQHYKRCNGWTDLDKVRDSDADKIRLAINNGIEWYFVIPALCSDQLYLKKQIVDSGILQVLQGKITEPVWDEVFKKANDGIASEVLSMWNKGERSTSRIADVLGIDSATVRSYLKTYAHLGFCTYNPKDSQRIGNLAAAARRKRRTMCIETGEIFESAREAARAYGIRENALYECLRGKNTSSGTDSLGNKLHWKYL